MTLQALLLSVFWLISPSTYAQTGTVRALSGETNAAFTLVEKCLPPCSNSSHEVLYNFRLAEAVWANFNEQLSASCLAELKNLKQGHIIDPTLPSTTRESGQGCQSQELINFVNWTKSNRMCEPTGSKSSAGAKSNPRIPPATKIQ